jgi:hypothetical protein
VSSALRRVTITADFALDVTSLADAYEKTEARLAALGCPPDTIWEYSVRLSPGSWHAGTDRIRSWSAEVDARLLAITDDPT